SSPLACKVISLLLIAFFFQAEDGIRDFHVTGVQTCALPISGVNNTYFLRAALNAQRRARGEEELDSMQFLKRVREKMAVLHLDDRLLHRGVNEGFSGGEKKRNEI